MKVLGKVSCPGNGKAHIEKIEWYGVSVRPGLPKNINNGNDWDWVICVAGPMLYDFCAGATPILSFALFWSDFCIGNKNTST